MNAWHGSQNTNKTRGLTLGEVNLLAPRAAQKPPKRDSKLWTRLAYGVAAVGVVGLSILIENLGPITQSNRYELSADALNLVGQVRDDASQHLKPNASQTAYEFVVPEPEQGGAAEHTGRVADAYSASFGINPKDGVSVTDKNTDVSVRLVPKFYTGEGKKAEGNQMVYPFGKNQLVYSLKYNGLKEDIIIQSFIKDKLRFDFELILPVGAEARLNDAGEIGIYTADSTLFGNMTYGSDEDRERVEKARDNGEKTNLIMTIPAPIVKDAGGQEYADRSVFELGGKNQRKEKEASINLPADAPEEIRRQAETKSTVNVYRLSIASTKLKELSYPISIDPTLQVTTSADFNGMNFYPGAEVDHTNNLVRRGSMTGGEVTGWASTTQLPDDRIGHETVVYNGYIYVISGSTSVTQQSTVYVSQINTSTGELGGWSTTTSLSPGRDFFAAATINGYLYVSGGRSSSDSYLDTVEYAKINRNGTLGSWTSTASLLTARRQHTLLAYDGYLYTNGGLISGGTRPNYSDYARLNADGSIAADSGCGNSWCTTTSVPSSPSKESYRTAAYNGFLYVVGGRSGTVPVDTVYYSRIASDGSLGSWNAGSSLNTARYNFGLEIWNGYMYAVGGCSAISSGNCGTRTNSVEYAPIYANGSIGSWRQTDTISTARDLLSTGVYGGRLYTMGGCTTGNCSTDLDIVEYTSINQAGSLVDGSWSTTTGFTTSRRWHNAHVYNGYMYVVGGRSWHPTMQNTIQYAAISDSGTIGSWTVSGNTFSSGRMYHASLIHNGYVYVSGGQTSTSSTDRVDTVEYAAINSDGSVGAWAATTSLPRATTQHAMFAWGNYLYVAGGVPATSTGNVERATINSDGTIGSWSNVGSLPNQMIAMDILVHGGYLYIVGGCNQSSCPGNGGNPAWYQTAVQYAPLNSDGTVGSWSSTSSFTTGRQDTSTFIYNGYLYITGGIYLVTNTPLDDVQLAPINSDGSLGSFFYTTSLPETYTTSAAVAWGGYMYNVGGQGGVSGTTNTISYQAINNGGQGSPATFAAGTTFTTARKFHASVAYNGYIYVLGGCTTSTLCTTATNTVRYAPLNVGGSIGSWSNATTNFTTARRDLYAFAYNGRMYVVSGREADGNTLYDIQYATIQTNGNINTSWTTDDTSFPSTGYAPGVALNGNVLYVLGGASSSTTTYYSVVDDSTGDVGSFTSTTSLPEGRYRAWTVIYKGYIYAIGGNSSGGWLRSVWYAPLNNDHTIGTWRLASTQLNGAIGYASATSAFTLNGFLYIAGGADVSGRIPYVQYAAIGASGDLGAWQLGITSGLTNHGNYAAVEYSGTMYITGGQITGTDPVTNTRYATIQSIPRVGSFNRVYDFDSGVKPENLLTRGVKQTGSTIGLRYLHNVSCDSSSFGNEVSYADHDLNSASMVNIDIGSSTLARCLIIHYVLDDRYAGVFPDVASNSQSYITDFDMYYIANPGSRLRGGRTFTGGSDRGLQAGPESLDATLLTFNQTSTNQSSYATDSVTPGADKVLLLGVNYAINNDANPSPPSSISGLGLTWDLVTTQQGGGTTSRAISLYRAQTGSSPPTPGAVTINFAGTQDAAGWALVELTAARLGNNGADALSVVTTAETPSGTVQFNLGPNVSGSATLVFANSNAGLTAPYTGTGTELNVIDIINPTVLWTVRYSASGEGAWTLTTDFGATRKAVIGVRILRD